MSEHILHSYEYKVGHVTQTNFIKNLIELNKLLQTKTATAHLK